MTNKCIGLGLVLPLLWLAAGTGCSRNKNPEKYLASANRFYDSHELDKARIEYLNVLRRQPTNSFAILRIGKILFRQGQLQNAYPALLESCKRFPTDVEAAHQLATIYLAGGQPALARTEALRILTLDPVNENGLADLSASAPTPKGTNDIQAIQAIQAINGDLDRFQKAVGDRAAFHVARAQLAQRVGNLRFAEAELSKALTLDPKSVFAHVSSALLSWAKGATNEAEHSFRTAIQINPTDETVRYRLAIFLFRNGRLEEPKKLLDGIIHDAPERTGAWTLRAEIALTEKQYADCLRLINGALAQAPSDFDALLLQGRLQMAQKQPAEAVRLLGLLVDSRPRSAEALFQLANAQLLNQEINPALASLARAAALDPNHIRAISLFAEINLARGQAPAAVTALADLTRRHPELVPAQLLLGRAYAMAGRPDDALALYKALRTTIPRDPVVPYQIGLLLRLRGETAEAWKAFAESWNLAPGQLDTLTQLVELDLAAKAPDKALSMVQTQLERQPKSAFLWVLAAKVHAARQDREKAEVALQKAVELEPESAPAYLMLAELHLKTGSPKQSIDNLDDLLRKSPTNLSALTLSGIIHAGLGNYDDAQRSYESALRINPNSVLLLNNLAYLLSEHRDRPEEAYVHAKKAHELAPDNTDISDTLGWIEYRRGHYREALQLLSEVQEKLADRPEVGAPEAEAHLGLTLYMMDQEDAARTALATALKSPIKYPCRPLAEQRFSFLNSAPLQPPDKAAESLEKRCREDPKDMVALLRLGSAYEEAHDPVRAREAYEGARKVNPASLRALLRLAILESESNLKRAMELARQAQRLAPSDPEVTGVLGQLALRSDDAETAYGLLQNAARQLPQSSEIWHDLAGAAFGTGRIDEAAEDLHKAVTLGLSPSRTNAAQSVLTLLTFVQNPSGATPPQSLMALMEKLDPTNGPALYAKALILERQGKFSEARDAHEKLLRRYPGFTPSTRQLATLYSERLNDDSKAFTFASKARTADPKDTRVAKTLGSLALRRGDFKYAVQLFTEVANAQPQDADLQFQLGLAYLRLKQLPDCRAALERAIALNPTGTFIPEARKILADNKAG